MTDASIMRGIFTWWPKPNANSRCSFRSHRRIRYTEYEYAYDYVIDKRCLSITSLFAKQSKGNAIYRIRTPNTDRVFIIFFLWVTGPFSPGVIRESTAEKVARINIEIRVLLRDMSLEIVKPANHCWAVIYGTFDTVLVGRVVGPLVTSEVLGVYEFFAAITTAMPLIGVVIPSMTPER